MIARALRIPERRVALMTVAVVALAGWHTAMIESPQCLFSSIFFLRHTHTHTLAHARADGGGVGGRGGRSVSQQMELREWGG